MAVMIELGNELRHRARTCGGKRYAFPPYRAGAAIGGTRLGNSKLNSNPYLRLGPGRMPKNNPFKASTKAPRLSIGKGPGNPHVDLRIRGIDR